MADLVFRQQPVRGFARFSSGSPSRFDDRGADERLSLERGPLVSYDVRVMIIGVPREVKIGENRVAVVPSGAQALVDAGHRVLVQTGAGAGSGIPDEVYRAAGAAIVPDAAAAWDGADLVVKVKEPIASEFGLLHPGLVLFTYLHLAAARELTLALLERQVTAIAYETVVAVDGSLPLLAPMSEVAGRLATQIGATLLQKDRGGPGILLGGVPGVRHGRVTVLGGGAVGVNAARVAVGMGAEVTLLDIDLKRLAQIDEHFQGKVETLMSNRATVEEAAIASDLLVGGVLVAGARAPVLVSEETVRRMRAGSVIVDVAVDQGGCIATIHPTTHADPTYVLHGVIHYGVTNMPALVPRTSTFALTNATLPYALRLAGGVEAALAADSGLAQGLNTIAGRIAHPAVAAALK
jgi:alanine dehydrogenase